MNSRKTLLIAVITIGLIWQIPYGQQILYPLSLLATYAHELGHGLTALLVGADFDRLFLHADGSGLAVWRGNPGRIASAMIAAGGLLGPSLLGVTLLMLSRTALNMRRLLFVLAFLLLATTIIWTRNLFGIAFLLAATAMIGLAAKYLPETGAALILNLLAVTLCLSLFKDLDYMFSASAIVDGVPHPSDTTRIAEVLWLPYWFWGALIAACALSLLAGGIWIACRGKENTSDKKTTSP